MIDGVNVHVKESLNSCWGFFCWKSRRCHREAVSHEVIIVCITLSPPSLHLFFHPVWSHLWHLWVLKVLPDKKETRVALKGEILLPLSLCGVIICSLSMIDHSWDFLNILFSLFLCVCWHIFVVFLAFPFGVWYIYHRFSFASVDSQYGFVLLTPGWLASISLASSVNEAWNS